MIVNIFVYYHCYKKTSKKSTKPGNDEELPNTNIILHAGIINKNIQENRSSYSIELSNENGIKSEGFKISDENQIEMKANSSKIYNDNEIITKNDNQIRNDQIISQELNKNNIDIFLLTKGHMYIFITFAFSNEFPRKPFWVSDIIHATDSLK